MFHQSNNGIPIWITIIKYLRVLYIVMIQFPLYLTDLQGGVIIGVNADTLKVKLLDGRIATVTINVDEFDATYEGNCE